MPAFSRNVGERAVAVVVEQDVLAALQPGRAAGHHQSLVQARARFRHGRGLRIEVDVVGDEQIEVAVAVVIDESAAGVPAVQPLSRCRGDAGLSRDVRERAVAVVVLQDAVAPVGDEQIVVAVVVVVADAHALAPAGARQPGFER